MKKRALVAQLDRAVVSGTTSVGGSNPSERVSVKAIGKTSQMIICEVFLFYLVLKLLTNVSLLCSVPAISRALSLIRCARAFCALPSKLFNKAE